MSNTTDGSRDRPLDGHSALISGASRGIGLECARALHGAGAQVLLLGRHLEPLSALGKTLGSNVIAHAIDLADAAGVARVLGEIRARLGGAPDIIVNNAGHFFLAPADATSVQDFERTVRVNLTAPFMIVREFLGDMKARRSGHVVTVGSIADHSAHPENAAYAASKYGARGLHEVLRVELRGSGVRVTLVSPGPVDTSLWDAVKPDDRPGFTKRADMLSPAAVADAIRYAVTCPDTVNVDELRLSRS